jgi:hypothetical protein
MVCDDGSKERKVMMWRFADGSHELTHFGVKCWYVMEDGIPVSGTMTGQNERQNEATFLPDDSEHYPSPMACDVTRLFQGKKSAFDLAFKITEQRIAQCLDDRCDESAEEFREQLAAIRKAAEQ